MAIDAFKMLNDAAKFVDEPDVLERVHDIPMLRIALGLERHKNWWGCGIKGDELLKIARSDGIPLAYVPRKEVIQALAAASDTKARLTLLLRHEREILDDCELALKQCWDEQIANEVTLAKKALEAYEDGHHEAAMALAVCLGEPLAIWASQPRVVAYKSQDKQDEWLKKLKHAGRYGQAKLEIEYDGKGYTLSDFKHQVLIAPIPHFFTPWYPNTTKQHPTVLSRHFVAHQPSLDHFTKVNSLLSLMLVTSVLKAEQEWCLEERSMAQE